MRSIYGILLVGSIGLAVMVCQCPRAAQGLLRLVRVQLGAGGSQARAGQAPGEAPPYRAATTNGPAPPSQSGSWPMDDDVGIAYVDSYPVAPRPAVAPSSGGYRGPGRPLAENSVGAYPTTANPPGGYRYPSTNSRQSFGQAAAPIDSRPNTLGQGFPNRAGLASQSGFPSRREALPPPRFSDSTRPAPPAAAATLPELYRSNPPDRVWGAEGPSFSPGRESANPLTARRTAATSSGASTAYPGTPPAYPRTPAQRRTSRWDPPSNPQASFPAGPTVQRRPVPCEGAQQLARVGDNVILACEILPAFNETLLGQEEALAQMTPQQRERQKQLLMQALLQRQIETMLVYTDFQRSVPAEGLADFQKRIGEQFDTEELPRKLQQSGLASRQALEAELRKLGSSLERQKSNYIHQVTCQWWTRQQLDEDVKITHEQMLAHYRQHLADYAHPTRSRWEQLTVLFQNHPTKEEAWKKLTWMGNHVVDGESFAEIAKQYSEGSAAAKGGVWDWTGQAALRSEAIDEAIFAQPVGKLGLRLEDERGFHIVRVIEREDAYHTPFEETQAAIRQTLQQEHKKRELAEYSKRLQEEIEVWTIFDEDTTASRGGDRTSRLY